MVTIFYENAQPSLNQRLGAIIGNQMSFFNHLGTNVKSLVAVSEVLRTSFGFDFMLQANLDKLTIPASGQGSSRGAGKPCTVVVQLVGSSRQCSIYLV